MEEAINRARYGSADLVYFENQNSNITGKQMHNLKDGEWLDDEIINFTMKAIQERNVTKGL
jgi:Ulp1 family protease